MIRYLVFSFLFFVLQSGDSFSKIGVRSICGDDDRRPSNDLRVARMVGNLLESSCCSATLISNSCMVSAGHCNFDLQIAEFNVPESNSNGKMNHSALEDQYIVDRDSIVFDSRGKGMDWAVFRVKVNQITGKFPGEVQGGFYRPLFERVEAGAIIRMMGHGADRDVLNFSQQMDKGPLERIEGAVLRYLLDTESGNSGAGIILDSQDVLIGVHNQGGCMDGYPTFTNKATSLFVNQKFKQAVMNCLNDEKKDQK